MTSVVYTLESISEEGKDNMKRILLAFTAVVSVLLCLSLYPVQGHAAAQALQEPEPGALTLPPPVLFQPFTFFDPDFDYLEKGGSYISELTGPKINIWGETFGTVHIDEIGVQLTLQRWTGSAWVDEYSGSSTTDADSAYVYQSHIISSIQKGYYYRTKSQHWIEQGTTYESGIRYSSSILIPL